MRLDLFLKKTCVIAQRSVAKSICDAGAVRVNGAIAKASQEMRAEDRITLQLARRELQLRVVEVPSGNVARRDAGRYVEILSDSGRDLIGDVFGADA